MPETRTRFAPSPTGFMHIGNLRTALYAYLLAKKDKGRFILRIEDTDQGRQVAGAVELIYKTMAVAGLEYDEGPDVGGPYGPYIQSQRLDIYRRHADLLISRGGAYYCFCAKERLEAERKLAEAAKRPYKYDGRCKRLTAAEVEKKLGNGESHVVRQAIPPGRTIAFTDLVFGEIKADSGELDEGVLVKADGLPTYNFANVVDDHLMAISHIIRGAEYISSTPKYLLLYEAFGWTAPAHIHLPLIMKNQKQKFSKREGDASFLDLLGKGYLKDAVINYIALLGWHPSGEQEIFSLSELAAAFDVSGLSRSGAAFDRDKLDWMNSVYIKRLEPDELHRHCLPYYSEALKRSGADLEALSRLLKTRIAKFGDIPEQTGFFAKMPDYDLALYDNAKMKSTRALAAQVFGRAEAALDSLGEWTEASVKEAFFSLVGEMGLKNSQVLWPLRVALSGREFTPGGAAEIALVLGREESRRRLAAAAKKLAPDRP